MRSREEVDAVLARNKKNAIARARIKAAGTPKGQQSYIQSGEERKEADEEQMRTELEGNAMMESSNAKRAEAMDALLKKKKGQEK